MKLTLGSFQLLIILLKQKQNKKFEWYGNSLNPFNKENRENMPGILGDSLGLIGKYKDHWLWNKDNTGDITKEEKYRKSSNFLKNKKVDMVTSDCGLGIPSHLYNEQEYYLLKIK